MSNRGVEYIQQRLTERAVAPMVGVSNVMAHHIRVAARANPPEPTP